MQRGDTQPEVGPQKPVPQPLTAPVAAAPLQHVAVEAARTGTLCGGCFTA